MNRAYVYTYGAINGVGGAHNTLSAPDDAAALEHVRQHVGAGQWTCLDGLELRCMDRGYGRVVELDEDIRRRVADGAEAWARIADRLT